MCIRDSSEIPVYGRVTSGVIVMRVAEGTRVVTVTRTGREPEELSTEGEEIVENSAESGEPTV